MRHVVEKFINQLWYPSHQKSFFYYLATGLLLPFSYLYRLIIKIRRLCYCLTKQERHGVPVCVVGNITVGGTGKTPFVIALAKYLLEQGYQPGIISRGYGGSKTSNDIISLDKNTNPKQVGEEPALIFQKTNCPVVVGNRRNKCIQHLLQANPMVNIIISDDGLQHYAMHRDIEIVLVDGNRLLGNGFCLPAGPLREPASRLKQVDYVFVKQGMAVESLNSKGNVPIYPLSMKINALVNLKHPEQTIELKNYHKQAHAVTAIANPFPFFEALKDHGIHINAHVFRDHHHFTQADFNFAEPCDIIMTEKDAVKCHNIIQNKPSINFWSLPIEFDLPSPFCEQLLRKIENG